MPTMPSQDYWAKRAENTLIAGEKAALEYERDLKKAYAKTIKQIEKEIDAFFGRYATDNQISLADARKRLTAPELRDFRAQARFYIDEVNRLGEAAFTAEYKQYLKHLSGKAYISRMDELVANIRHNMETLATGYTKGLQEAMINTYEDSFYRTMFDIQKQAGFGTSFTTPGGKQLERAVRQKWLEDNFSDKIWKHKDSMIAQLDRTLSQEFVRGRNPRDIALDFSHKMNVSYSNAQRLIRTEMNYISNKGSMKAYADSGVVKEFRFLSTLDHRTSDICRELDGKVFKVAEGRTGVNMPPLHPYCRSTTVPHFEDSFASERIARGEDGKTYKIEADMTYYEWVEKYGSAAFKQRVAKQKARFKGV